jgi:hypothetical protein
MVMLKFLYEATDSAGAEFHIILRIPTQANEARMNWNVAPGKFGTMGGKAFVLDGPEDERGSVIFAGKDNATEFTLDQVLARYDRSQYGYFRGVSLKNAGTGRKHPFSAGSVAAGEFTWKLLDSVR